MIFVDSNVPMYLVGGEHPNRDRARHAVETAVNARELLVTHRTQEPRPRRHGANAV